MLAQPNLDNPGGLRDRAILEVFYSTGMRRMELANLQLFDVDFDRQTIFVRQGKGKKDRMVPVGERALAWVNRYLIDVRPRWAAVPDDNWLFLTHDGTPFSASRLTQMTRNYIRASGVGKEGACHPAASNELRRDDDTQQFLDAALDNDSGEVMSKEELLAALDQEFDLENRPHPGETTA